MTDRLKVVYLIKAAVSEIIDNFYEKNKNLKEYFLNDEVTLKKVLSKFLKLSKSNDSFFKRAEDILDCDNVELSIRILNYLYSLYMTSLSILEGEDLKKAEKLILKNIKLFSECFKELEAEKALKIQAENARLATIGSHLINSSINFVIGLEGLTEFVLTSKEESLLSRSETNLLNFFQKRKDLAFLAVSFHDLGKAKLEPSILEKRSILTNDEFEHIKKHVHVDKTLLKRIDTAFSLVFDKEVEDREIKKDFYSFFLALIAYHHPYGELKLDFPLKVCCCTLSKEDIEKFKNSHLLSLVSIADIFDASLGYRPYNEKSWSKKSNNSSLKDRLELTLKAIETNAASLLEEERSLPAGFFSLLNGLRKYGLFCIDRNLQYTSLSKKLSKYPELKDLSQIFRKQLLSSGEFYQKSRDLRKKMQKASNELSKKPKTRGFLL